MTLDTHQHPGTVGASGISSTDYETYVHMFILDFPQMLHRGGHRQEAPEIHALTDSSGIARVHLQKGTKV
jgi:hypothetical protein